jgi:hypothetical protein
MLSKHIDVVALLLLVLGLLAFSQARELRFVPEVHAAGLRIQNAIERAGPCPFSSALTPRFR